MCFILFIVHIYQRRSKVSLSSDNFLSRLFFLHYITLHLRLPLMYIAGFSTHVFLPRIFNIITKRHINIRRIIMYTFFLYFAVFTCKNNYV